MTNNLFQGVSNQMTNQQDYFNQNKPNNGSMMNWMPQNNVNYMYNRPTTTSMPISTTLPGRVIFSPEQISPQEIPTNGYPAVFPLSDGSKIIVKALAPNGSFEEQVYSLETQNSPSTIPEEQGESEFDKVMNVLGTIESRLNTVLDDLYGTKKEVE